MDKHKTFYTIYSVVAGIPFGLGMILYALINLSSYPKTVEGFAKDFGPCTFFGDTLLFSPSRNFPNGYSDYMGVKVNNHMYVTELNLNKRMLKTGFEKFYNSNSSIVIWYKDYNNKQFIQQLSIDNRIILEYEGRPYGRSLFLLIPGVIFLIVCSGYLYNRMKENDWFKK